MPSKPEKRANQEGKRSFILHRRRDRFRRRRKFTPLPDLSAVFPKNDRNWDEDQSNAAQEGTRPFDTESIEHVHAEEGEDGSGDGSEEGVCCYCRGGTVRIC